MQCVRTIREVKPRKRCCALHLSEHLGWMVVVGGESKERSHRFGIYLGTALDIEKFKQLGVIGNVPVVCECNMTTGEWVVVVVVGRRTLRCVASVQDGSRCAFA